MQNLSKDVRRAILIRLRQNSCCSRNEQEASAKGILSGDTGASGKTVTSAVTVVIDSCRIQLLLEDFAFYELLKTAQHSGSSLQYICRTLNPTNRLY